MESKKIYIAGKLNADAVGYLYNVHKMMNTAQLAKECGYSIFVPALDLLMGIMFGYTKYEDYFDNNSNWLRASDAVLLVEGWETSKGTKKEIEIALENNIPVFDYLPEMTLHFEGIPGGAITELVLDEEGNVTGVKKERVTDSHYMDEFKK